MTIISLLRPKDTNWKWWLKSTFEFWGKTVTYAIFQRILHNTWTVMSAIFNICNNSFHGLRPRAWYFSQGFMKKYLSLRLKSSTALDSRLWMCARHLQWMCDLPSELVFRSCSRSSIMLRYCTTTRLDIVNYWNRARCDEFNHSNHSDVYQTGSLAWALYSHSLL